MENIFLKHKTVFGLFAAVFLVFMYFHFKYSLGLFFDMPAMFFSDILQIDGDRTGFIIFREDRVRFFSNLLAAIPFNAFIHAVKNHTALNALSIFSLSYFIVQAGGLILNYLIALRTKRYDIAAVCFAFYCLFSIQNAIWACREVHIAVMFYFALLSYFLSEKEIGGNWESFIKDIIPAVLICLYLFEGFEITVIFGLILFTSSFLYLLKNKASVNHGFKLFIGFLGLAFSIYIPLRLVYFSINRGVVLNDGASEYIEALKLALARIFDTNSLIMLWGIALVIAAAVIKKPLNKIGLAAAAAGFTVLLYFRTHFMPDAPAELASSGFVFIFIYPVITAVILMDYFNKKFSPVFLSNLIVIACITGIMGFLWQIHSCFEFQKYTSYLKDLISKSEKTFVTIPENDFQKYDFLRFNSCFGTMHKAVFLSDDYKITTIIIPAEYYPDYSKFCLEDKSYYDKENNRLYLQTSPLAVQNRYWDLTEIKNEFEKIEK